MNSEMTGAVDWPREKTGNAALRAMSSPRSFEGNFIESGKFGETQVLRKFTSAGEDNFFN
jgi:hypothetical protein